MKSLLSSAYHQCNIFSNHFTYSPSTSSPSQSPSMTITIYHQHHYHHYYHHGLGHHSFFHPITPSVSSMWFLLSGTYMLYFLVFFFCVMISLIGNTIVRVLSYSVDRKPLKFPLIVHYLYMSCTWTLFLFLMHLYSSTSDAEPREAHRWREAPVPCVCWYMYLQTSSQENIVSRPHTLPMSVWYDFHCGHLLRNRCMKPSAVAMQKTSIMLRPI